VTFERRVAGDALQLVGVVRDFGPDAINRLLDLWGAEHVRAVCVALAAAVDVDRTPSELWGWLGEVDNRTSVTVRTQRLLKSLESYTDWTGAQVRNQSEKAQKDRARIRRKRGAA
jgi:hypothetical protein